MEKIEGVNYDINDRWENGISHRNESIELYKRISQIDFEFGGDSFCFSSGGDGDNGEQLMYLLDIYFDEKTLSKKPKVNIKERLETTLIKTWKPLFENNPKLKKLPVYSWGRFYKYECSGDPFETEFEGEFYVRDITRVDYKLLDQIELTLADDSYKEFWEPSRKECVKIYDFDDRGGMCLCINKNDNNEYFITAEECDSPE